MDFYFANKEALLEWVKENVKLVTDKEYGYYGDMSFQAKMVHEDTELASESESHYDSHCSGCRCYED